MYSRQYRNLEKNIEKWRQILVHLPPYTSQLKYTWYCRPFFYLARIRAKFFCSLSTARLHVLFLCAQSRHIHIYNRAPTTRWRERGANVQQANWEVYKSKHLLNPVQSKHPFKKENLEPCQQKYGILAKFNEHFPGNIFGIPSTL